MLSLCIDITCNAYFEKSLIFFCAAFFFYALIRMNNYMAYCALGAAVLVHFISFGTWLAPTLFFLCIFFIMRFAHSIMHFAWPLSYGLLGLWSLSYGLVAGGAPLLQGELGLCLMPAASLAAWDWLERRSQETGGSYTREKSDGIL